MRSSPPTILSFDKSHRRSLRRSVAGGGLFAVLSVGCAVIQAGEVGVKSRWGKVDDKIYEPGRVPLRPISEKMLRVPTRTVNREVRLDLPSKEGLNVRAEISILYHIQPDKAPKVIREVGPEYEEVLILSVFRSASADICARFLAKDMHSGNRAEIEEQIRVEMDELLAQRGFTIEAVLLKSISLPPGLYDAIEDKLEAEQDAQRMTFVLQRERQEAERKAIEAEGVRDAQKVLADGLSEEIIEWRCLEVLGSSRPRPTPNSSSPTVTRPF